MKKVSIIYYSSTGHVEAMADHLAKGAELQGAIVKISRVQDAKVNDVLDADIVAFGSPSMDGNTIESDEMQPFITEFKLIPVEKKKCFLFGSYGWDKGEFMDKWVKTMIDYDFDVIDKFIIHEAPAKQDLDKCFELGKRLVTY